MVYLMWNFLPLWGSKFIPKGISDAKYARRKKGVWRGVIAFVCTIGVGFLAGGIAQAVGGWGEFLEMGVERSASGELSAV